MNLLHIEHLLEDTSYIMLLLEFLGYSTCMYCLGLKLLHQRLYLKVTQNLKYKDPQLVFLLIPHSLDYLLMVIDIFFR
jgi:hypothetical protein